MSEKKKQHKETSTHMVWVLLIALFFLKNIYDKSQYKSLITFFRDNPIILLSLSIPVILFFIYSIRANTWEGILSWMKKNLIRYIMRFASYILLAYLTFFLLIDSQITDIYDFLIAMFITLCTFLVFLFLIYVGEEAEYRTLNKKLMKKIGQNLAYNSLIILIPALLIFSLYKITLFTPEIAMFLGWLHTISLLLGFAPHIEKRWAKVCLTLVFIPLQSWFIYTVLKFNNVQTSIWILPAIAGAILMILALLIDTFASEDNIIKKLVYEASEFR